jgi:transposase-like protein
MNKWEKRKNESAEAYEAAECYFGMGVKRSMSAVCEKLGKSLSLMKRWSSRHAWIARAIAFDAAGYAKTDALARQARVDDVLRQAKAEFERRLGQRRRSFQRKRPGCVKLPPFQWA